MSGRVHSSLLDALSEFLSAHMGLFFPPERRLDLLRGIREAAVAFGFEEASVFIRWIMSAPLNRRQIEVLARFLTVGETYFMREKKVLEALEKHILPDLIRRCRIAGRPLKIWSAGCCTGEEPYTVAMMIDKLAPGMRDLQVNILGTDINQKFLEKAKIGVYTEWSFRGTPAAIRSRYFENLGDGQWQIHRDIRKVVQFSFLNLAADPFPGSISGEQRIDLILCRNVLMYFKPMRLKEIVQKYHHTLDEDGWLVVGPSESSHVNFDKYNAVEFPGAILYKKTDKNIPSGAVCKIRTKRKALCRPIPENHTKSRSLPPRPKIVKPVIPVDKGAVITRAKKLYESADYPGVVRIVENYLNKSSSIDSTLLLLLGRAYANMGQSSEGLKWIEKAIKVDKMNPKCYHLQATLLQEQNRLSEASESLRRALYLDPDYMMAHFMLGNLCRQDGRHKESEKYFQNTMTLLKDKDRESILPDTDGVTAGGLLDCIKYIKYKEFPA